MNSNNDLFSKIYSKTMIIRYVFCMGEANLANVRANGYELLAVGKASPALETPTYLPCAQDAEEKSE